MTGNVYFQPSPSTAIPDRSSVVAGRVAERIRLVTGLSLASAEDFELTHYHSNASGTGAEHYDWGRKWVFRRHGVSVGDRMATFMIYLGTPDGGGHTAFTDLNLSVAPEAGSALFWHNLKPTGSGDVTISKRRHEKITALNGVGWQAQAKTSNKCQTTLSSSGCTSYGHRSVSGPPFRTH